MNKVEISNVKLLSWGTNFSWGIIFFLEIKQMLLFHLIKFKVEKHVGSNFSLGENDRIVVVIKVSKLIVLSLRNY